MASHPAQRILYPMLYPLGKVYAALMAKRRKLYTTGKKNQFSPQVPCISVGNISWGGSGKTPVVDWLLGWAHQQRMQSVVLTRGYKASPPTLPYLVTTHSTPHEAGDEPCMLAKLHPEAHIVVDPVRKRSGAWAEKTFSPKIIILDDGFQHLAVKRHLDLVLLKPEDLRHEWDTVIPAGSWRENAQTLTAAQAILIKTTPERFLELRPLIEKRLSHLNIPVFNFTLMPTECIPVFPDTTLTWQDGSPYILFSGVGEPVQVKETATRFLGAAPRTHHTFPDHHAFTANDIRTIAQGDIPLICTPKDAVKLPHVPDVPLWTFSLQTTFHSAYFTNETSFSAWWATTWRTLSAAN